jgi:molecular chaperone GrpE (heat shock protein)
MQKKESYLLFSKSLLDFKNEFEQNCEQYLEDTINGANEGFAQIQVKFNRLVEKECQDNQSKNLDYLKKDILFEINTLEDLMNQSVFRLRESEEEMVISFLASCDYLNRIVFNQLKRNNIIPIHPNAHEVFNGKLHEVLMLEEEEGFKKGEIIRTQNSGFAYGNMILTRASVIASK